MTLESSSPRIVVGPALDDSPRLKNRDPVTAPFTPHPYNAIHLPCTRHSSCDANGVFSVESFRGGALARFLEMLARRRQLTKGKSTGGRGIIPNWIISDAKTCRVSQSGGNDDPAVRGPLSPSSLPVPRRSRPPVFPFAIIRSQYSRDSIDHERRIFLPRNKFSLFLF